LPAIEEEAQRRREEARANAAAALAASKLPERMAAHGDGSETREKTLAEKRSKWSFKPGPRKEVPNFDALHDAFFRKLKEAKKNRPATVVREFKLHENDAAQRERDLRAIEMDAKMDEKILPEVRWPFASLRAKVNSTPPPAFAPPSEDFLRKNENLATKLRRQAVAKERAKGQFMTKAEREAKAEAERARENRHRAAAWAKAQIGGGRAGPGAEPPLDQHRAARRKQQEALAKETVEKVLLENNVYTYVEEGTA
jgi:protein FAM161A